MITVIPFTQARTQEWDSFVDTSRNGTFFHTRAFLAYHPEGRFDDASLFLQDGEKILAVFPAAKREKDGKSWLVAHPGASYGGIVLSRKEGGGTTGELLDAIIAYAKEQGYAGIDFLRITPASLCFEAADDQEYWLYQKGATLDRLEFDSAVTIPHDTKDHLEILNGKCRNMVRQGERGNITTDWSDHFDQFWKLLEQTLEARHSAKPTHTIEEITRLHQLCPNQVRLRAAYLDGKMVAGIVVISAAPHALYTLYMGQDYQAQNLHPMHVLVADLLKVCAAEHRNTLHLGVSTEDGGKVLNTGLLFFKEGFGARPITRQSWSIRLG